MRRAADLLATWGAAAATVATVIPLVSILAYTLLQGMHAINIAFLTHLPAPVGTPGGGVGNAIVGTGLLVAEALLLGVPVGVLAGVYLSELAARSRHGEWSRFAADVLAGVPTIVIGVFVYGLLVVPLHSFNALSGGCALAIILLPTVVRTADSVLRLVPDELRSAALALGVPEWRVTLGVVLRAAAPGVTTGVLLGLARVAGETAPLLFTAFGNPYWSVSLFKPVAALPLIIFEYAISPYKSWIVQAWGAALILIAFVVVVSLATRYVVRKGKRA